MPTLRKTLKSKVVINPKLRNIHLVNLAKGVLVPDPNLKSRLSEIEALLADQGIDDLSKTGKLEIRDNITPTRGLLRSNLNDAFGLPQKLIRNVEVLDGPTGRSDAQRKTQLKSLWVRPHRTTPIEGRFPGLFSLPGRSATYYRKFDELDFAVWVSDEVDISDDVTVLFTAEVSKLVIIANTLRVGDNVMFTHQKPEFDYDNSEPASQKKAKPQNKVPNRENQRIHGDDGDHGKKGRNGRDGIDAPVLELFAASVEGSNPSFIFAGQDGQDGQQGQQGQNGQDGARGSAAKAGHVGRKFFASCERRSGSGGNGGRGGNGGPGGDGGDGGDGGQVTFYLTSDAQQSLSEGFSVSLDPGRAGSPGPGGDGGDGGNGGALGKSAQTGILGNTSCGAPTGRSAGRDGRDGDNGEEGEKGSQGETLDDGNIRFVTINEDDIRTRLNAPMITRLSEYRVKVGDSISIEGKNLPSGVTVKFDDVEVSHNTRSDDRIAVTVPDLEGGEVDVRCLYNDGNDETNVITLKVLPDIQSVTQGGETPARFIPGKPIVIQGTGLSDDLILMVNERPSPDVELLSKNELKVELIRPFEDNEYPDALGEEVSLQLIANEPDFASNEFPITLDTFRVLIIGDSIIWGQGLQDHEKFSNMLVEEIRGRKSHKGVYPDVYAHSGATIGYDKEQSDSDQMVPDDSNLPALQGEVPTSYPTILQQMEHHLDGESADSTIDLILVDGGINDVAIDNILHPTIEDDELKSLIDFHCYRGSKKLLQELVARFPKAKILYTGYFKILSDDSYFAGIDFLLTALGFQVAGVAGAAGGYTLSQVTRKEIVEHCALFADRAHASFRQAIEEVKSENDLGADHITFVDPEYDDRHAALAPDALLFGIGIPSLDPLDNDVVAVPRASECALNEDRTSVWKCERASIGHPTPDGADRYYLKILEKLDAVVPVD